MREYLPLLIVCAVIGVFTILFLAAYAVLKRKTKAETSERHMSDSEIIKRLLGYARPYKKDFVLVFLIMLVSIAYDVVSPLLVADIQGTIKQSFELSRLYSLVAVYAGILAVSMVCTYFQAMILQKTGQKILSQIRLDTFTHISSYLMKDLCDSKEVPELMQAHFDAGEYGVKSEKGFYDYSDGRAKEATKERDEKFLRVYQALYGSK